MGYGEKFKITGEGVIMIINDSGKGVLKKGEIVQYLGEGVLFIQNLW